MCQVAHLLYKNSHTSLPLQVGAFLTLPLYIKSSSLSLLYTLNGVDDGAAHGVEEQGSKLSIEALESALVVHMVAFSSYHLEQGF